MPKISEKLLNIHTKCVLIFPQLLTQIFLILRRIRRDVITNVYTPSCNIYVNTVRLERNFNCQGRLLHNLQMSNYITISPVVVELCVVPREGRANTTKLSIAFQSFADALPN
jgi:hypothetical protein